MQESFHSEMKSSHLRTQRLTLIYRAWVCFFQRHKQTMWSMRISSLISMCYNITSTLTCFPPRVLIRHAGAYPKWLRGGFTLDRKRDRLAPIQIHQNPQTPHRTLDLLAVLTATPPLALTIVGAIKGQARVGVHIYCMDM